jgi:hypothetical protein
MLSSARNIQPSPSLHVFHTVLSNIFRHGSARSSVGTCSPGQVDPTGKWRECLQSSTGNDNSSVNLRSHGHCTRVFIGTRVATHPLPKTFLPSSTRFIPRIFPQVEVQTVITEKAITDAARNTLIRAGSSQWAESHLGLPTAVRVRD